MGFRSTSSGIETGKSAHLKKDASHVEPVYAPAMLPRGEAYYN
jgi:hypothetical protein